MHVLYSFPDRVGKVGIGSIAFHQVREVAAQGVDVTLFCTSLDRDLPPNVRVVRTLTVAGRRIPHRAVGIERSYRYHDLRVGAALRRLHREVDLVHCWPRATIRTARAARAHGIPCLREVPNTHTAHAFEVVSREVQRLGLPPVAGHSHTFTADALRREQREYELADALLVPSDYSRGTFLEQGVPEDKLVLHQYGYDPQQVETSSAPDQRADGPLTAIFVGRCEPRKGLHLALRAWLDSSASERGRFVVCGSFVPGYREALAPLLEHPSVDVRGFVEDPAIVMRQSDVFVFPSIEEGSALVTYEAMASGCVLLVSEATGARCRDGVDGLVHAPGDVESLTAQLDRLDQDRTLLLHLSRRALERAPDLAWPAAGRELVGIYAKWSS